MAGSRGGTEAARIVQEGHTVHLSEVPAARGRHFWIAEFFQARERIKDKGGRVDMSASPTPSRLKGTLETFGRTEKTDL